MLYYFIINGREDFRERIDSALMPQIAATGINSKTYYTLGEGDGTRFVRIYCDLHPAEEVCFVACGGSGTANEVASGLVGFKGKSMAILAYGATNDFIKSFPGRDFTSLKEILGGEVVPTDIIRANDSYALNVVNVGFDASVALNAKLKIEDGTPPIRAYKNAVLEGVLFGRVHHIRITADGEALNRRTIMFCDIGNGGWCGGQYRCSPKAQTDDGLMEVSAFRPLAILEVPFVIYRYGAGTYLDDDFCRKRLTYRRAKHMELDSRNLIYLCLDGEFVASTHFDIDILPKEINLVLPPLKADV